MSSTASYLTYILDQLSDVAGIRHRAMMGEYILYCRGKIIGGIYDDRLLVKSCQASERLLPDAHREVPYEGAKDMLLVENVDDKDFLCLLVREMAEELPEPKPRKRRP